jgi:hypothetical protein
MEQFRRTFYNFQSMVFRSSLIVLLMMISNHVMAIKWYVNDNSTTGDVFCTAIGAAGNTGLTPGSPKNTLGAVVLLASNTDTILLLSQPKQYTNPCSIRAINIILYWTVAGGAIIMVT